MDLRLFLDQQGIPYTWSHHDPAYTAQDLAMREHIPGRKVIKPVVVNADGRPVLCALPASYYIDMEELRRELGVNYAELAPEPQFSQIFSDCEVGAEPPIGSLFGVPTILDDSVVKQEMVMFQAGSHSDAVMVSVSDYLRLAQPTVAHFGRKRA